MIKKCVALLNSIITLFITLDAQIQSACLKAVYIQFSTQCKNWYLCKIINFSENLLTPFSGCFFYNIQRKNCKFISQLNLLISIEMDGKAGIMQIAQWDVGLG